MGPRRTSSRPPSILAAGTAASASRSRSSFLAAMKNSEFFGVSLSFILVNLVSIMERADENLLPSVYKEVSEAFNAGPSDLGYLTFIRNFVQGVSSPIAGVLAIKYDRPTILAMGTFCWALSTAAVGVCQHFGQVAFWRAVNGFGLAIVIPALQSFIADSYKDNARGTGFGLLNLIGSLGGIGGGVLATVMAGQQFWGIPGWRCAFILIATLSSLIGFLILVFVVDPRKSINITRDEVDSSERDNSMAKRNASVTSLWQESWVAMKGVMGLKTFQILVLQGIVGSMPWTAMVFFTMWFELIGFDHKSAATLISLFAIGCAGGCFIGGLIADHMSKLYPYSGRVMCAQFCAFMGIPFSFFLLTVIPQSVSSYYAFAVTLLLMGLTISWNGSAVNAPIFAEVVPVKHRTMIYAFDRAFEGSISSLAAPLVGILSEKLYGYGSISVGPEEGSFSKAIALSKGLLAMMPLPFGLCCLCYTPLYLVFRWDRENARERLKEEEINMRSLV